VLGGANLLTNVLFITTFLFLRRMERGHPPLLDYDGHAEFAALQAAEPKPHPGF